jgi:hypothetical protein
VSLLPSRKGGNTWGWGPLWWNRNYVSYVFEPERPTPPSVHMEPASYVLLGPVAWKPRQFPEVGGWRRQPRYTECWVQETEEPWRCGVGRTVKLGNHTYNIGLWKRRPSPVDEYHELISTLATTPLEGD